MGRKVSYELFELGELQGDALEKAKYKLIEYQGWFEWWDSVYEHWKKKLGEEGYSEVEIEFSGFSSQGDGASFTAKVDLGKWLSNFSGEAKEKWAGLEEALEEGYLSAGVERTNRQYSHPYTVTAVVDGWNSSASDELVGALESAITEDVRSLCRQIYSDLEEEWEYQCSDEALADLAEANNMLFFEWGEVAPRPGDEEEEAK